MSLSIVIALPASLTFWQLFSGFIKCAVIPDGFYRDSLTLLGTFFIKGKVHVINITSIKRPVGG